MENCPVCSESLTEEPRIVERRLSKIYVCPRCGKFELMEYFNGSRSYDTFKHLLSAWIWRQNKIGVPCPIVPDPDSHSQNDDKWLENLKYQGFPLTVTEKLDALLLYYSEIVNNDIGKYVHIKEFPHCAAEIAARDIQEVYALNKLLYQLKYLDCECDIGLSNQPDYTIVGMLVEGWKKIEMLRSQGYSNSNSAFVALWFDSSNDGYRESAKKIIQECGYNPIIIDEPEFNGFIMDEVVAGIRKARFVIADYTCRPERLATNERVEQGVRGGVYWEAGLAYGMGKQVIHTCQEDEDSRKRIHFDVQQYRTIFWRSDRLPDFEKHLKQRILATVGQGTYQS